VVSGNEKLVSGTGATNWLGKVVQIPARAKDREATGALRFIMSASQHIAHVVGEDIDTDETMESGCAKSGRTPKGRCNWRI
jgi:hypothetical protein